MPATQQKVVYQQFAGNSPALQTGYNGPPSHHDEGAQWKELLLWSRCWSRPLRGLTQRRVTHSIDALVRAIRAGATYANVRLSLFTPGEICSQIPGSHAD
jgi:hypothetical protein